MKLIRSIIILWMFGVNIGCVADNSLPAQPSVDLIRQVGIAMQTDDSKTQSPLPFSKKNLDMLKTYVFTGPIGAVNPLYYDQVKNIEKCQITRFYYDLSMNVKRSEVINVSEEQFWKPISLLAKYYLRFSTFPENRQLDTITLEAIINAKVKIDK